MQIDTNAGVCSELAPIQTSSTPTAPVFERLALASGDSDKAMLQADVYPVGLQSQKLLPLWIHDDHVAVDTWQPLPVVSAAGRAAPVGSVSGMLPAGFENHVQIKRWGLKIKFPKV
jgi:hypothetical protein